MDKKLKLIYMKSLLFGFIGAAFFALIYFGLFAIFMSVDFAIYQIKSIEYWLLFLIIGFSIQISLFVYINSAIKQRAENLGSTKKVLATTSTISTTSMFACCAHHLGDFLVILGIGFLSAFVLKFQTWFLLLGILSNIFGILFMLKHIKKHNLVFNQNDIVSKISQFNLAKLTNIYLFLSISFLTIYGGYLII